MADNPEEKILASDDDEYQGRRHDNRVVPKFNDDAPWWRKDHRLVFVDFHRLVLPDPHTLHRAPLVGAWSRQPASVADASVHVGAAATDHHRSDNHNRIDHHYSRPDDHYSHYNDNHTNHYHDHTISNTN
nr:hypothetical protein BaRGS_002504 [Batillaria attramentaria]